MTRRLTLKEKKAERLNTKYHMRVWALRDENPEYKRLFDDYLFGDVVKGITDDNRREQEKREEWKRISEIIESDPKVMEIREMQRRLNDE